MLSLFWVSDSLYVVFGVFTVLDFLGSLPGPATFVSGLLYKCIFIVSGKHLDSKFLLIP